MINLYKYTDKEEKELLDSMTLLIDTREKKNENIIEWMTRKNKPYKQKKLDYADYSMMLPANEKLDIPRDLYFDGVIAVEKKGSLEELCGNFSKERARIEKEFAMYPGKLQMIIENATYKDIRDGNYKSEYSRESFLGTLHSFKHKYDVDFIFLPDPQDSPLFIYLHFRHYLRFILR